jgi:hypothetical protein
MNILPNFYIDYLISRMNLKEKYIYIIQNNIKYNNNDWYFYSIEKFDTISNVKLNWVSVVAKAHKFVNERDVEEFKSQHTVLKNTSIIRIEEKS